MLMTDLHVLSWEKTRKAIKRHEVARKQMSLVQPCWFTTNWGPTPSHSPALNNLIKTTQRHWATCKLDTETNRLMRDTLWAMSSSRQRVWHFLFNGFIRKIFYSLVFHLVALYVASWWLSSIFMTTFFPLFHYFGVFIPPKSNFLCSVHLLTHLKICITISAAEDAADKLLLLRVLSSIEWKWRCKQRHKATGQSSSSICFSSF